MGLTIFAVIVGSIAVVLVVVYTIYSNMKKGEEAYETGKVVDQGPTILFKIFLGWGQTLAITSFAGSEWPDALKDFVGGTEGASNVGDRIIAISCLDIGQDHYDKMVFFCIFSVGIAVFIATMWWTYHKRTIRKFSDEWTATNSER